MDIILSDPQLRIVWCAFVFITGLAFGSFANVLIHRLPRKESIIKPPSHCPACNTLIKPYDNIPLFSYIILLGKCRYCGDKISFRYFLVELLTGVLFAGLLLQYGFSPLTLFYTGFAFIMLVHAFIDYDHYLLLDKLNITAGLFGILILIFFPKIGIIESIVGTAFGGGLLLLAYFISLLLFKKEGMGLGDIKTAAVCGFFLGPVAVIYMLLISAMIGLIWGLAVLFITGEKRKIPFGVMMTVSAIVIIFLENTIENLLY